LSSRNAFWRIVFADITVANLVLFGVKN